jgi:hypothetical protein
MMGLSMDIVILRVHPIVAFSFDLKMFPSSLSAIFIKLPKAEKSMLQVTSVFQCYENKKKKKKKREYLYHLFI